MRRRMALALAACAFVFLLWFVAGRYQKPVTGAYPSKRACEPMAASLSPLSIQGPRVPRNLVGDAAHEAAIWNVVDKIELATDVNGIAFGVVYALRFVNDYHDYMYLLDFPKIAGALISRSRHAAADEVMKAAEERFLEDDGALREIRAYRALLRSQRWTR